MNNKFDFILLPPDSFHQSFNDLFSNSRKNFNDIELLLNEICKKTNKQLLIKYRTPSQRINFPCFSNKTVSYGNLLNFCKTNTKIIGPVSTALLESLIKNIPYFAYDFVEANKYNRMLNNDMTELLYISRTPSEVINNINKKKIYKPNKSCEDLFCPNPLSLNEIINSILNEK